MSGDEEKERPDYRPGLVKKVWRRYLSKSSAFLP
jgi:hypothetical protein